jgi:hypothetical protein
VVDEESAYAHAADELEANHVEKATWAKAFSEADGDTEKAKARYIKLRVIKLTTQEPALASVTGAQLRSGNARQTSPVDSEISKETEEEHKARLWKEAQDRALGHIAGAPAPFAKENAGKPNVNSAKNNNSLDDPATTSNGSITELYEAIIGEKNTSYYLTKFEQFDQRGPGFKLSWNWAAFFFTGVWALYRKMYGWFFAIWGAGTLVGVFDKAGASIFAGLVSVTAWVAFGFFANSIYHTHAKKKIAAGQLTVRGSQLLMHLRGRGGVNTWAPWLPAGLVVVGILIAIVIPLGQQPISPNNLTPGVYAQNSSPTSESNSQLEAEAESAYARNDFATAIGLFRQLADQGYAPAKFFLGFMYNNGQGLPQDYAEAVKWIRQAAEQGYAPAQFVLGNTYADGKVVPQDYSEAVKWYGQAADKGYLLAQYNLGIMFENGQGVPQDYVSAYKWLNLAATKWAASDKTGRETVINARNAIASVMTPDQMAEAQSQTREWRLPILPPGK